MLYLIRIYLADKTIDGLEEKIEKYEEQYPAAEYGTTFSEVVYDELKNVYYIMGTRSSS